MHKSHNLLPIGVFDSGVGGISVLADMIKALPHEQYLYMADSANAPYGTKDCDCIREISLTAARELYSSGIKAMVVACNTATSAAINDIRAELDIPVIGIEPALKPAVETCGGNGVIVVMATPLTLKENKFNTLLKRFEPANQVFPVPCPGLVELIETEVSSAEIIKYLQSVFGHLPARQISSVVLGCTHYCFIRPEIAAVFGKDPAIVDGNMGTVRHLVRTLAGAGLLSPVRTERTGTQVEYIATGHSERVIPLCQRFLARSLARD